MLIQFSVKNFLSFKDLTTFDMTATSKNELEENILSIENVKLLKSAVFYGANASGKTNFLNALSYMRDVVLFSFNKERILNIKPFALCEDSAKNPSSFEIVFITPDNKKYIYGFEIYNKEINKEYLFEYNLEANKIKPKMIFTRERKILLDKKNEEIRGYHYEFNHILKKDFEEIVTKTRNNALFLNVAQQFNNEIADKIMNWFRKLIYTRTTTKYNTAKRIYNDEKFKNMLISFLQNIDISIVDIIVEKEPIPDDFPKDLIDIFQNNSFIIKTKHKVYDKDGKNNKTSYTTFSLGMESVGTQKIIYNIFLPMVETLTNGGIFIVDELDCSLHPLITKLIIKKFNSIKNTKGQLIFTTHDTNLLTSKLFRRDQIWFAEKNKKEATEIYSLADFKVRKDASYGKDYILGKYGAIPFISSSLEDFLYE